MLQSQGYGSNVISNRISIDNKFSWHFDDFQSLKRITGSQFDSRQILTNCRLDSIKKVIINVSFGSFSALVCSIDWRQAEKMDRREGCDINKKKGWQVFILFLLATFWFHFSQKEYIETTVSKNAQQRLKSKFDDENIFHDHSRKNSPKLKTIL